MAENTLTSRGRIKICHEGFMYTKHKRLADGSFRWRCVDRVKRSCRASCKGNENGDVENVTQHNHEANNIAVE